MKKSTLRVCLLLSMIGLASSPALAGPLHEAVKAGHLDEVKQLIASGADVNAPDKFHNPPLYWAATKGQVAIAEELIAHGANINAKDKIGATALHTAASTGQVALLEFLISNGAQVDIKDQDFRTPLHQAAYTGQSATADALIAGGADVNARTEDFFLLTPLHLAVNQGHKEVVELLITRGAKVNVGDGEGITPLQWAVNIGYTDIVELLKRHLASPLLATEAPALTAEEQLAENIRRERIASSSPTGLFDDFNADMIDRTKWANTETVRRVENGKFVSTVTRFGSNGGNTMNFAAAREITGFKADVTVTDVENVDAEMDAWLVGAFYNNGTPGSGIAGDVLAGVEISHNGTELVGQSWVAVCITDSCNVPGEWESIHWGTFAPVALNETHTLSIDFDGKKFTFGFDGRTLAVDPTSHTPVVGPPHAAFKGIGTWVDDIDGPDEGGFIAATFDTVMVNGSLYDDFESDRIDRTKWANTEVARRVENGKFVSTVTRFGLNGGNTMNFVAAREITGFKADVTVTDVENDDARPVARLVGAFYNDGTPGSGIAGDVLAGVTISHNGTELLGSSFVAACITESCNVPGEFKVIHFGTFGPVALNETHTLSIDFDGKKFIFGFDGRTVEVDPTSHTPVVGPPHAAFKGIGTRVGQINGPDEGGFIAATFDNVVVIFAP